MRVALLLTDLERGGAPLRIARTARRLRAAGVDVHVGCLAPLGAVGRALAADGVPVFACDAQSSRDLGAIGRLARLIRVIAPNLIHSTLTHANVCARLVGAWLGVPVVGSTATIEVERPWHVRLERLTARRDRVHVVNSRAVAAHVTRAFGVAADRIAVVPPSVDPWPPRAPRARTRAALGLDDAFTIAWVGRLDPVKRVERLIEVAARWTAGGLNVLIAGDGPQRTALTALTALAQRAAPTARVLDAASPRARICWLGWRDDVADVLSAADVFVLPSRSEGMPNAVLEALACGLPVVASATPSLEALVEDGAPLTLAGDADVGLMLDSLTRLARDADARAAIGGVAEQWARAHLDPQRTTEALLDVYSRALRRR